MSIVVEGAVPLVSGYEESSLWLAKAIFDLGGISFGDFTIGRTTVHSPVYVNPRVLLTQPAMLRQVIKLIQQEVQVGLSRRKPRGSRFDLVAGVPFGGLLLATAFSLIADLPLVYAIKPTRAVALGERPVEGRYTQGQTVLIMDDLITTGGSVLETAATLEDVGLVVKDAVVLVDRERGAGVRLGDAGYNLIPMLKLKTMLNYYYSMGMISPEWYQKSMAYLEAG